MTTKSPASTETTRDEGLRGRLTALTRDLILIPSTESRPDERRRCFELFQNHLDSLDGVQMVEKESGGYASLIALPATIDEPEILLCGHLDVVEHPASAAYRSTVENGRIIGPGAGDMKGALAILLDLFRSFHQRRPGLSLGLAVTSDEERGGFHGVRYLLEDQGLRCGRAIIPDGGSLNDLTIAEKGVLHLHVRSQGQAAHAARPWLASNALEHLISRLAAVIAHFRAQWPAGGVVEQRNHWFDTCSVTIVATSNESINRIPGEAEAYLDIRFTPPHTVASMLADLQELCGPDISLQPAMTAEPSQLDPDEDFIEITEHATGAPVRRVRASGGSDARFFCAAGIPVNVSRPLVGNLHAADEWIDVDSMLTYHAICETFIARRLGLAEAD